MRELHMVLILIILLASSCVTAQEKKVDEALEEKAFEAYETIQLNKPNGTDPVNLGALVVWNKDKSSLALVMRVLIADDWHIYASQKGTSAFIMTELKVELPNGIQQIGEWIKPDAHYFSEDLDVYEGELLYIGYFKVTSRKVGKGKVGLYYQTCDLNQCFPPKTKMVDLDIKL
ncbi:hypothetical protein BZG02_07805 [Labilibaculum filiforme]|uniref:Thiol:disulfide interchange protein DsbD N-terminal domain-containing protein n=1 Tax=Labilibaculum filiforme TaxID=1940526 RepID=A0A2N3I0Q3_9BACT|nr:protein-disulfide reductase DsbD domain-containing protein [Labilibaculum filiforme]PKQ63906.1 hypothetical protein BZG02_07805 [Labilibaculum filiforme]